MWEPPTYQQFQAFFARDFFYTDDNAALDFVTPNDISQAISEALINFNAALYGSNANTTTVFMYLAAFCLARKIVVSTKGLSSQSRFPIGSNSVGGVSISFSLPEVYSKDAWLSALTANGYGMRFLEFTLPYLTGNVFVARGGLSPYVRQGGQYD